MEVLVNKMAWTSVPLCLVSIAFACATKDDSQSGAGGSSSNGSSNATSGQTTTANGATTGTTTTSSATGGSSDCAMAMTGEACEECVCAKHQAGCDRYWQLEDEHCYCGMNAPCVQQCTTACMGGDWTTCDMCADTLDDTCYTAAMTACDADADCSAYFQESSQSCDALP